MANSENGEEGFVGTLGWDGSLVFVNQYSTAIIEVTTFSAAITVNGGIAGTEALQVLNLTTGATASTIAATGLYAVPATGTLSLSGNTNSVVNLQLKK